MAPNSSRFPGERNPRSPDSSLGFQVNVLNTVQGVPSSLGSRPCRPLPSEWGVVNPQAVF